jgi:hypothetical protein
VPRGSQPAGKRPWKSVTSEFELSVREEFLLLEAGRTADILDCLAASGAKADLVELRQQRSALVKLLTALGLPEDDAAPRSAVRRPSASMRRAGV